MSVTLTKGGRAFETIERGRYLSVATDSNGAAIVSRFRGQTELERLSLGASTDWELGPYEVAESIRVDCLSGAVTIAEHEATPAIELYRRAANGDFVQVSAGGSDVLVWDDLRFPAQGINPPGTAADPARDTSTGVLMFSGTLDNIITGIAQLPHAWARETAIKPHLHLRFPTASEAVSRWRFEYDIANPNEDFENDFGTYTLLSNTSITNPNNAKRHHLAGLGTIDMTGYRESTVISWKLTRTAQSDATDVDAVDIAFLELDFHYQRSKSGTFLEFPSASA